MKAQHSRGFFPLSQLLVLLSLCATILATSLGRTNPLSYISHVSNITIHTPDQRVSSESVFSLTIEIPSTRNYNNIERRWLALSDPNAADRLKTLKSLFSPFPQINSDSDFIDSSFIYADGNGAGNSDYASSFSSERLFHYLTRNSTLEYPSENLVFKLALEPNSELSHSPNVFTLDKNGNMIPHPDFVNSEVKAFKGTAYRQVATLNPATGVVSYTFKRVGWARIVVTNDGSQPLIEGAWKVDDEEGLGIPASIYHISKTETFDAISKSSPKAIYEHEQQLLSNIKPSIGNGLVVWRDADMHPTMYKNFDLLEDDLWYKSPLKKAKKRGLTSIYSDCDPYDETSTCYNPENHLEPQFSFQKRSGGVNDTGDSGFSSGQNLASTVGDTSGCPNRRRIALVGIAGDCNFVSSFNSSSAAREYIIEMVNTASQVYESSFNVTLGISALVLVNDTSCPSSSEGDTAWNYACSVDPENAMNKRLSAFSQWRGGRSDDGVAGWTLLTSCTQSSVVGLSWMGMVCGAQSSQNGDSYVAGANVVAKTTVGWRVYAHELGHTFGAVHDCTSDTCQQNLQASSQCCVLSNSVCSANGQYIMNPSAGANQDTFSPCTLGNVCSAIGRNTVNSTCLTSNTGVKLVTTNECGNGIVEEGEECDCGTEAECANNSCCDPKTCKFKNGAECDDSNELCCNQCKFSSTETKCRSSTGPCDFDIYCPGNSSVCPSQRTKADGEKCQLSNSTSSTDLTCISGHCTSRDLQCVTLLANTTISLGGSIVNVTRACDDDRSCRLSCVDPSLGSVCISTSQNFLDGTPCRGSGRCRTGICVGGSDNIFGSGPLGSWISRNKGTVIAIVVSVLAVLIIACAFSACMRMYRNRNNNVHYVMKPGVPPGVPPGPPAYSANSIMANPNNYENAYAGNVRQNYPPPPPPPVAHQYDNGYGGYDNTNYNHNGYTNLNQQTGYYNSNSYEMNNFNTHSQNNYPPPPPPAPQRF